MNFCRRLFTVCLLFSAPSIAQVEESLGDRTRQYLSALIKIDTTNPPGNESHAVQYLKKIADSEGIPCELLGGDSARLNFVARLEGSSSELRPLLLMAHTDVVPAERSQWKLDPFSAEIRDGYLYGRGAQDDKSLLAAELAVMVDLKRRGLKPRRTIILLAEADEEAGSSGIQWLIKNAYSRIDAEFAINEGGFGFEAAAGQRVFQIQTAEKIPSRITLTARGTAAHGSLPRPDNPVLHLARAITRAAEADQPIQLNTTTRRYLREISKVPDYKWVEPHLTRLEKPATAIASANEIRARDPELDAQLRTTVSPTMLTAGLKINVIPNVATAQLDVRRLPTETREEIVARIRKIVNDPAVEVSLAPGQTMPATEPSSLTTALYIAMESAFKRSSPRAIILPYMTRGATDGAFLREKGMAVYGAPIFQREDRESRAHGNDERIGVRNLAAGAALLLEIVESVAR